jgi:hypothetical protein
MRLNYLVSWSKVCSPLYEGSRGSKSALVQPCPFREVVIMLIRDRCFGD